MSRAFIKNDDADEPVVIPPRAPLPPGVPNYVTPRGFALLKAELAELETERASLQGQAGEPPEQKRRLSQLAGLIAELTQRIASARVVDFRTQPRNSARFGATVTLMTLGDSQRGEVRRFTIVGVDEADAAAGRIAFTAPLAHALLGRGVGEQVMLETATGEETLRIDAIEYGDA
jgi:transcription elongation factor GreB